MNLCAMAAVALVFVSATGCAGTPSSTPPLVTPARATASPADPCASPPTRLTLGETDGGERCVAAGGTVEVYLRGTAADRWSPIVLSGTGLRPVASGKAALPVGVTGGFFAATGPGLSRLAAYRAPCTGPDGTAPGCDPAHLFLVTVVVR